MVSFPGVHNLKDQLVPLSTKTNGHVSLGWQPCGGVTWQELWPLVMFRASLCSRKEAEGVKYLLPLSFYLWIFPLPLTKSEGKGNSWSSSYRSGHLAPGLDGKPWRVGIEGQAEGSQTYCYIMALAYAFLHYPPHCLSGPDLFTIIMLHEFCPAIVLPLLFYPESQPSMAALGLVTAFSFLSFDSHLSLVTKVDSELWFGQPEGSQVREAGTRSGVSVVIKMGLQAALLKCWS